MTATTRPEEHVPRGQDLVVHCPQIYRRALELVRGATSKSFGTLQRDQVRSLNFSGCEIGSRKPNGINVHVTLESAPHVLRGYRNRLDESVQFGRETTKGLSPKPVAGVGDRGVGGGGANWLPALNQLLSVRGRHLLAVNFFVHGVPLGSREALAKKVALTTWGLLGVPRS